MEHDCPLPGETHDCPLPNTKRKNHLNPKRNENVIKENVSEHSSNITDVQESQSTECIYEREENIMTEKALIKTNVSEHSSSNISNTEESQYIECINEMEHVEGSSNSCGIDRKYNGHAKYKSQKKVIKTKDEQTKLKGNIERRLTNNGQFQHLKLRFTAKRPRKQVKAITSVKPAFVRNKKSDQKKIKHCRRAKTQPDTTDTKLKRKKKKVPRLRKGSAHQTKGNGHKRIIFSAYQLYMTFAILLGLCCVSVNADDIKFNWKLTPSTVYFGNNVTVHCLINYKCTSLAWVKWNAGEDRPIHISSQNISNYPKYDVNLQTTDKFTIYTLRLNNIDPEDVEQNYRCDCDFFNDNRTLFEMETNVAFVPEYSKSIKIVSGPKEDQIYIQNVYPVPQCTVIYESTNLSRNVVNFVPKGPTGRLLNITFNVSKDYPDDVCIDAINISCIVGTGKVFFPVERICSNLTRSEESGHFPFSGIVLSSVLIAAAVILAVIVCIKRKSIRKLWNKCMDSKCKEDKNIYEMSPWISTDEKP